MRALKTSFTAQELMHLPTIHRRLELVEGRLFEMPFNGAQHGHVTMQIGSQLGSCVKHNGLGKVFAPGTGFILHRDPDTVRAPDVSFIARDRLPPGELPAGYLEIMPDLAAEVLSPNDRSNEVRDKVEDWLRAGVKLVWVIYPANRSATVYRSMDDVQELSEDDSLDGEQVVPGFTCRVGDLFL